VTRCVLADDAFLVCWHGRGALTNHGPRPRRGLACLSC
jgi:hypothetical protein